MHKASNKQLKKNYQQATRAMGVFLIRNNLSDKLFVGCGMDLHGIINRHKFQLTNGIHPNKQLQSEWNELGSKNFAFEIMDELPAREGDVDYRAELDALESLWLEKLQPFGERGYNEPKLSKAEMLRRMRQKSGSREHYE
ncbi:MAG TPA: GIY-YIG nuclease family protein [Pyrinomonadaceae bacterium]|nr:GIY-YIG nuclease family protein [Pyrinomonadaceae bacterium]